MRSSHEYRMKWEIASAYGQEKIVMQEAGRFLLQRSVHPDRVEEMLTAVSEACLNALEHGNRLRDGCKVTVHMNLLRHHCTFRIYDEGNGFDEDLLYAGTHADMQHDNPRGWGFLFITSFADHIRLGRENGKFFVELMFLLNPEMGGIRGGNGTGAPC